MNLRILLRKDDKLLRPTAYLASVSKKIIRIGSMMPPPPTPAAFERVKKKMVAKVPTKGRVTKKFIINYLLVIVK